MELAANIIKTQFKGVPTVTGGNATPTKDPCPFNRCDGSGLISFKKNGLDFMEHCECLEVKNKIRKIGELFDRAGIPKKYAAKTLDQYSPRNELQHRALEIARRYVEKYQEIKETEKNGLYFVGPTGTGKTHLAYAIVNALIERYQIPAVVSVVPDLLDLLRPKRENNEAENRLELAKSNELLLLDDFGSERESSWVTERMFVIVNARCERQLPTIITSNVPLDLLEKDVHGRTVLAWERITSKIRDMCYQILMDGEDFRRLSAR